MAEGGEVFDDFEMKNRYPEYDETDDDQLELEYSNLVVQDDGQHDSDRITYVEDLMSRRRLEYDEDAFVDDGKTVTIKNADGSTIEVPGVEFVHNPRDNQAIFTRINDDLYSVLDETLGDNESTLNESKYDEVVKRLKNVKSKNKANIDDQLERVAAVTKIVQIKNKVNLYPTNRLAREILDRSVIIQLKDGEDTLWFKPKLKNGGLSVRAVQIMKRGKTKVPQYSAATESKPAVDQYKKLISDYRKDIGYRKILSEETEPEDYPVVDVQANYNNYIDIPGLTPEENREHRGVLNPTGTIDPSSRLGDQGALQIQANYYEEAMNETEDQITSDNEFNNELTERIVGLRQARDQTLDQRQLEEIRDQQEEDISRLDRFKEWVKENMLGLSAIAITIAGLITTVVVGARKAIGQGSGAAGSFGRSVYNTFRKLAKRLGPVLGPIIMAIGNLLVSLLKYGAMGLAWLASNLWVLVLAIVWMVYDRYGKRK